MFAIQQQWQPFHEPPLRGAFHTTPRPSFQTIDWMNGTFQDQYNTYIEENIGFRNTLIRINNQLNYGLFKVSTVKKVIIGSNGTLFEKPYLESFNGDDFIGSTEINLQMQQILTTRNFLKNHQTKLLMIFAPNKAFLDQDHLPAQYKSPADSSNYSELKKELTKQGIPLLDVNDWFCDLKKHSEYPLFTPKGTHWSEYGAVVFADSLLKRIMCDMDRPFATIKMGPVHRSTHSHGSDEDLSDWMNLLFRTVQFNYAYFDTVSSMVNDSANRPTIIVVGDSFFWNLYKPFFLNCFHSIEFWYYNQTVFSPYLKEPFPVKDLLLPDKIARADYLIILSAEPNLTQIGFGLFQEIDSVINLKQKNRLHYLESYYLQHIRRTNEWMDLIREKALDRGIGIDSMLIMDVRYMGQLKHDQLFSHQ
ncbi:MAG: hypothetical protein KQI35_07225 [Bacteroidetes bacterium]|nr:hypothetical protein [Bacteroidota bacterium]